MVNELELPRFLRPSDCGRDVSRSAGWVYGLIAAGELRAVRVKGSAGCRSALRVPREVWLAWLNANVTPVVVGDENDD